MDTIKTTLNIGDFIKVHIMDHVHQSEIRTRNYGKTFEIVPDLYGSPGIWWYGEDGGLSLLASFSWTVVFEDVNTGALYHNVYNAIVPLDKERYSEIIPR